MRGVKEKEVQKKSQEGGRNVKLGREAAFAWGNLAYNRRKACKRIGKKIRRSKGKKSSSTGGMRK